MRSRVEKTGLATTRSIGWTVQELPSSEDLDDYPDKRLAVSWDHRSTLSFTKSLITSLKKVNWKTGEFIDGGTGGSARSRGRERGRKPW